MKDFCIEKEKKYLVSSVYITFSANLISRCRKKLSEVKIHKGYSH